MNAYKTDVMNAYKTKEFARLARKAGLSDRALCQAVARAERGLIDAKLGRFLIKQRIAREGQGQVWRISVDLILPGKRARGFPASVCEK
jgi:hypothetical protein